MIEHSSGAELPDWAARFVTPAQLAKLGYRQLWLRVLCAEQMPLTSVQTLLVHTLALFMDAETGRCWVSLATLERASKLGRSTVKKALDELEGGGFLQRVSGAPLRRPNAYTAALPAVDPQRPACPPPPPR